jgi:hypothetical protein
MSMDVEIVALKVMWKEDMPRLRVCFCTQSALMEEDFGWFPF